MKSQRFGIEIELTGITRAAASKAVAVFLKAKHSMQAGAMMSITSKTLMKGYGK